MLKITEKIMNGENPKMVFFGDSITQGCFEFENGYKSSALRPQEAYHSLLKERIKKDLGRDVTVINAGIGGNFSDDGLKRIQEDVLDKNPDFCCIMFGTNDVTNARKGKRALEHYKNNMKEMIAILQENGIEVLLMTPSMLANRSVKGFSGCWRLVHKYYEYLQKSGKMDQYAQTARQAAREMDVPVADAYACWKTLEKQGVDTTGMLCNGMNHPAAKYHKIFSDCIYEVMFS